MWQALSSLFSPARSPASGAKLYCFHCQEVMSVRQVVTVRFDGAERQVCCHGCAAVLATVQENGLSQQYWAARHAS